MKYCLGFLMVVSCWSINGMDQQTVSTNAQIASIESRLNALLANQNTATLDQAVELLWIRYMNLSVFNTAALSPKWLLLESFINEQLYKRRDQGYSDAETKLALMY